MSALLNNMKKKPAAGIGKPVSELVPGTALKDRDLCFGLMDDFVAYGGNTLDTARIYGWSEEVIGLWMEARANRDRTVVVTKGGLLEEDPGRLANDLREKVGRHISRRLECLRTDYIDLYFLHRDTPSIPVGVIVECLNEVASTPSVVRIGNPGGSTRRSLARGINWRKIFSVLLDVGYDYAMVIEHEDPVFRGERFDEGLRRGLRYLKQFI